MSDTISRQAAIDDIKECAEAAHDNHEWDMEQGYLNAIECIEELPSAQPEHLVKESGNLVNNLVNDCISRQAVLEQTYNWSKDEFLRVTNPFHYLRKRIDSLPPVIPQPKIGKWLAKSFHEVYCDNCGFDFDIMTNEFMDKMKYCPNCGAKMEVEHE